MTITISPPFLYFASGCVCTLVCFIVALVVVYKAQKRHAERQARAARGKVPLPSVPPSPLSKN